MTSSPRLARAAVHPLPLDATVHLSGGFIRWKEDEGEFALLGGHSCVEIFPPHFHETFTIVSLRSGPSLIDVGEKRYQVGPGAVCLANAYEVTTHKSLSAASDYDVCYPTRAFMEEIGRDLRIAGQGVLRFAEAMLENDDAAELADILATFCARDQRSAAPLEEELFRYARKNPCLFVKSDVTSNVVSAIGDACLLIDEALDQQITIGGLSERVGISRFQFARAFQNVVGLPPSRYIRQRRLARGFEQVRAGAALADVAVLAGFSDQAHFTREFKRLYGTTPGKFARDIRLSRANRP